MRSCFLLRVLGTFASPLQSREECPYAVLALLKSFGSLSFGQAWRGIDRAAISAIDTKISSTMALYKWTLASIKKRREMLIFVLLLLICVFHLAVWWVHLNLELLYSISHLVAVDGDDPLTRRCRS